MRPNFGMMMCVALALSCLASHADAETARVPLLDSSSAWARLPKPESGGGGPLPAWARALADSLPRTTAAMLDLDRLHRTKSPLGPELRGKMRWVVADANRCGYSKAIAAADLKRSGVSEAEIEKLAKLNPQAPAEERAALRFAHEMTLRAYSVTDDAVAELKRSYGDEKLTAMVLLIAAANFQDRLFLALGLELAADEPMEPVEARFDKKSAKPGVPKRLPPEGEKPEVPEIVDDPEWVEVDFGTLQANLTQQRQRSGRIRVPSWDEVLAVLPKDYPNKQPVRIQWSLVCMGYQPELALAWSACTTAFREEAKQDRVFEESLFWIVTRQIHCFY